MSLSTTLIIAAMLSNGFKIEMAYYPEHGPSGEFFARALGSFADYKVHALDEPFKCYETKEERLAEAKETSKKYRKYSYDKSFFIVWDLQYCDWADGFQGGRTSQIVVTTNYIISSHTAYIGFTPDHSVKDQLEVFWHELKHMLDQRHCIDVAEEQQCIKPRESQ